MKKTQPQDMLDAYGARFSQQDLTDPVEMLQDQPLKTPEYQEGDLAFARAHQLMTPSNVNRTVPRSTVKKAKTPR